MGAGVVWLGNVRAFSRAGELGFAAGGGDGPGSDTCCVSGSARERSELNIEASGYI